MGFYWTTVGDDSCAVCLAREGYHEELPPKHLNCDCEIYEELGIENPDEEPFEDRSGRCFPIDQSQELDTSQDPPIITTTTTLRMLCSDGDVAEGDFDIEQTLQEFLDFVDDEAAWKAFSDEFDALRSAECRELEWECTEFEVPAEPGP